jgi:hypothetical protein
MSSRRKPGSHCLSALGIGRMKRREILAFARMTILSEAAMG